MGSDGKPLNVDDPRHGTYNGYQNLNCRCQPCRDANAEYVRKRRSGRAAEIAENPRRAEHGRVSTYHNWGCRCDRCTEAHRFAKRRQRARRRSLNPPGGSDE